MTNWCLGFVYCIKIPNSSWLIMAGSAMNCRSETGGMPVQFETKPCRAALSCTWNYICQSSAKLVCFFPGCVAWTNSTYDCYLDISAAFFKVPASKGIFWELRPCGSPFGGFCLQVLQPFFAFLVQNLDDMMTMTMTMTMTTMTTMMMMMTTMMINGYEVVRRLCMRPQDFETEDICNYIVWIQHFGIVLNPTSTPKKNFVRCSPSFFFNPEFPKKKNQIRMICFSQLPINLDLLKMLWLPLSIHHVGNHHHV